jgi:hypothetical protein
LETAFDEAWPTLKSIGNKTAKPDELACAVLRLAIEGERDPVRLHELARHTVARQPLLRWPGPFEAVTSLQFPNPVWPRM